MSARPRCVLDVGGSAQCDHEMGERKARRGDDVQGLAAELFAEGRSHQGRNPKAQSEHRQADRRLELGAVEVLYHSWEAEVVCGGVCSCVSDIGAYNIDLVGGFTDLRDR